MKKRFKILVTIATFVLTIAMTGFGVFAAQSVSVSISNTVSYVCYEVFVDVSYKIGFANTPKYQNYTAQTAAAETYSMGEQTGKETTYTYVEDRLVLTDFGENLQKTKTVDMPFGKQNGCAMKIEITINNVAKKTATYTVSQNQTGFVANSQIGYSAPTIGASIIAAESSATYTYYVFITDVWSGSIVTAITNAVPQIVVNVY